METYMLSTWIKGITGHNKLAYFQSKLNPEIDPTCRLCLQANETHDNTLPDKNYGDLGHWWRKGACHKNGYIVSFASPWGIERVSKIVMCISTKLCYMFAKLQIPRICDAHLNAAFMLKLITSPEMLKV